MATKKPKGLGLGLEALLGPKVDDVSTTRDREPTHIALDRLQPGKYQPRRRLDEGALYELAESIRSQGVVQPILVRPLDAGGYEVIAGERRLRAARIAGLTEVPVVVKSVSDEAAAVMALIENIQREDLNPLEEAQGLRRLTDEFGLTHEQAAQAVGRSRSAASNLLRLLNLAAPVQQMLLAGDLEMGHARALLALEGADQIATAAQVATRKLSVRQAERLVARVRAGKGRSQARRGGMSKTGDIARLEEELSDSLTAPVEIRVKSQTQRGQAGEVAIGFATLDDLDALIAKLKRVAA